MSGPGAGAKIYISDPNCARLRGEASLTWGGTDSAVGTARPVPPSGVDTIPWACETGPCESIPMPVIQSHSHGSPCWFELGTTDQSAAKSFYSSLLGWASTESPIPGGTYTMFFLDERSAGAAYTMTPDMAAQGIPPHWMIYFAVDDADAAAARVKELGGSVRMEPFDVMEHGRMAVCSDPAGAVFSVWQARGHQGVQVFGEMNSVCWVELASPDIHKSAEFYGSLFGWKVHAGSGPMPYGEIETGGERKGGLLQMNEQWQGIPPHWGLYFLVQDCDAAAARVKELDGKICHGPFDAPGVGRIAVAADPQGAMFSMIRLNAPA